MGVEGEREQDRQPLADPGICVIVIVCVIVCVCARVHVHLWVHLGAGCGSGQLSWRWHLSWVGAGIPQIAQGAQGALAGVCTLEHMCRQMESSLFLVSRTGYLGAQGHWDWFEEENQN